ncbi:MAG: transposase [Immundisolibacter sp.]|uniref:transposase n=1 Tax=Immundisolibacter sp. TaxID=1934948 RepID=UPI0019C92589|nr:transposase [Immundisolibacter sp.]MBC7162765.1 transposase [Immundisolibacter sp.]
MHASGQLSFSDAEFDGKKKVTRRERLLGQLESLLPWPDLIALIEPHYPNSGRPGQQPLPLASMLRVHVAQIAYNCCDPGMEDALYEVASLRRFFRVELAGVPDESTLLRFRRTLEEDGLGRPCLPRSTGAWAIQGSSVSITGDPFLVVQ